MIAVAKQLDMQNGFPPSVASNAAKVSAKEHMPPLCFNKAHFSRSDFNVERFVNLARRRATLEQIHNDLRTYLRVLQNSMVELINDDYTEFVNLSSNLAALKESIDKITSDISSAWESFSTSTSDIQKRATLINRRSEELTENRKQQLLIRNQISLLLALDRLAECLTKRPADVSLKWLSRLTHLVVEAELLAHRLPENIIPAKALAVKDACFAQMKEILSNALVTDLRSEFRYVGSILSLLSLVRQTDFAVSRVITNVIDVSVDRSEQNLDTLLKNLYAKALTTRQEWRDRLSRTSQRTKEVDIFIDQCFLNFVVSFLDEHFSSVTVPSDNRLFHSCYSQTENFIRTFLATTPKQCVPFLKEIKDKFNCVVYFKLETQPSLSDFEELTDAKNFPQFCDQASNVYGLRFQPSVIVLTAIRSLFSDEVFIAAVIDKFWDFSIKMLMSYADWLSTCLTAGKQLEDNRGQMWKTWTILCRDVTHFDGKLFDLCLNHVWERFKQLHVDPTPFGQCLTTFSQELAKKRADMVGTIRQELSELSVKDANNVSEIPRQYRWTKRPTPTQHSPYVEESFAHIASFSKEAAENAWESEHITSVTQPVVDEIVKAFCEKAVPVLENVEQSKLFKKKGTSIQDGNAGDTDESKIRRQLFFDIGYVKETAQSYGVVESKLDQLALRALADSQ